MTLLEKIINAAGGEVWRRPKTLHLSGEALFTPNGEKEKQCILDQYRMYRVFPENNQAAHKANGKVRFDALYGENVFFQLKFDGQQSQMKMGELAKPYATHFQWSNNFGFGILRFADQAKFEVKELVEDQIEGHACHFIKITDPEKHETLFAVDQDSYFIRMVGFPTTVGYHHRIYSDFDRADNGFIQARRIRIYFDGIKWMDIRWNKYQVNEPLDAKLFQ